MPGRRPPSTRRRRSGSFGDEESVLRSEAHFLASIADGWVSLAVWKSTSVSGAGIVAWRTTR